MFFAVENDEATTTCVYDVRGRDMRAPRARVYARLCADLEKFKADYLVVPRATQVPSSEETAKEAGHQNNRDRAGESPATRFSARQPSRRRFPLTVVVAVACCNARNAQEDARVVRGSEGGLRHRSVGTLVTSAEPRAEGLPHHGVSRLTSRYIIVQREVYEKHKRK